jgi:hypothetical protein
MSYLTSALAQPGWRHRLWLGSLLAASLGLTLGFACAVPFAAFGAVAALTLRRRDALLVTVALWLLNQIIGFTVLHYPWDAMTLAWGAILGIVALLSTAAALTAIGGRRVTVVTGVTSFAAAFAVYEGSLYLVSAVAMGVTEDFAAATVLQILEINAAAFAGLLAVGWLIAKAAGYRTRSFEPAAAPVVSR